MHICVTGINYRTAPVAIREKIAGNSSIEGLAQSFALYRPDMPYGVMLSTCNRTEIYTVDDNISTSENANLEYLRTCFDIPGDNLAQWIFLYRDRAAVEHLFRVISGLESQVIGEYEILGQGRQALENAERARMVNLPLRYLFNSAIRVGRRVRETTGISKNAVSVSSVAVDLAAQITGDLAKCRVLVIGTGEAGQLAARVAGERGASQIVIMSRTWERSAAIARLLKGCPTELDNLEEELSRADIVFACAAAPHRLLSVEQMQRAAGKRSANPLVIVDIGMPRNVDPEVRYISNIFLYNLDDLTAVCDSNRQLRIKAIQEAEDMILEELARFTSHWQNFDIRPVIRALVSKAETIRAFQLDKTLKKLPPLSDEQRSNLEAMTKSIITKILQDPIDYLKNSENGSHQEAIREIFKLNPR